MSTSSRDGGDDLFKKSGIILRRLPMHEGRPAGGPLEQKSNTITRIDLYFKSVEDNVLRKETFLPGHAPTVITGDAFVMDLRANGGSGQQLALKSCDAAPLTLVWGLNERDQWECIVIGDATEPNGQGEQTLDDMLKYAFESAQERPQTFDAQQHGELKTWLSGLGIAFTTKQD